MGYTASELIAIAKEEIGYLEKATNADLDSKTGNAGSGNFTKYARDLYNAGYYNGDKNGHEWCEVFVDWCHWIASGKDAKLAQEVICQTGPYGASCTWSAKYYRDAGRFFSTPQIGDHAFFGTEGDEYHSGIVSEITDSGIYVVAGNTPGESGAVEQGGCVGEIFYTNGNDKITGYGRPRYGASQQKEYPKIRGNTVGTPMPRPDWNQTNPNAADYILNKPDISGGVEVVYLSNNVGELSLQGEELLKMVTSYGVGIPVIVAAETGEMGLYRYYVLTEKQWDDKFVCVCETGEETDILYIKKVDGTVTRERTYKGFKWLGTLLFLDGDINQAEIDSMEGLGHVGEFSEFYILATIPPATGNQLYIGSEMWKWLFFSGVAMSATATRTLAIELKHVGDGWWRGSMLSGDNVASNFVGTNGNNLYANFRSHVSTRTKLNKLVFYSAIGAFPEGTVIDVYGK